MEKVLAIWNMKDGRKYEIKTKTVDDQEKLFLGEIHPEIGNAEETGSPCFA